MLIAGCLGYKHWSPYWVYIILILTPLVKPFHLDIMKKININKQHKSISIVKGNEKHKQ